MFADLSTKIPYDKFVFLARKRLLTNTLCANVTCLNGGECFANENGPQCSCPSPYFGQRCEISKSELNDELLIKDSMKFF